MRSRLARIMVALAAMVPGFSASPAAQDLCRFMPAWAGSPGTMEGSGDDINCEGRGNGSILQIALGTEARRQMTRFRGVCNNNDGAKPVSFGDDGYECHTPAAPGSSTKDYTIFVRIGVHFVIGIAPQNFESTMRSLVRRAVQNIQDAYPKPSDSKPTPDATSTGSPDASPSLDDLKEAVRDGDPAAILLAVRLRDPAALRESFAQAADIMRDRYGSLVALLAEEMAGAPDSAIERALNTLIVAAAIADERDDYSRKKFPGLGANMRIIVTLAKSGVRVSSDATAAERYVLYLASLDKARK